MRSWGPVGSQEEEPSQDTPEILAAEAASPVAASAVVEPVGGEAAVGVAVPVEAAEVLPRPAVPVPVEAASPAVGVAPVAADAESVPAAAEAVPVPVATAAPAPPRLGLGLSVLALGGLLALWRDGRRQNHPAHKA